MGDASPDAIDAKIHLCIARLCSLHEGEAAALELIVCGSAAIGPLRDLLLTGNPSNVFEPRRRVVEVLARQGHTDRISQGQEEHTGSGGASRRRGCGSGGCACAMKHLRKLLEKRFTLACAVTAGSAACDLYYWRFDKVELCDLPAEIALQWAEEELSRLGYVARSEAPSPGRLYTLRAGIQVRFPRRSTLSAIKPCAWMTRSGCGECT